jgi:hypothetical protein
MTRGIGNNDLAARFLIAPLFIVFGFEKITAGRRGSSTS